MCLQETMELDSHMEKILWTEDTILQRVHELGAEISRDFKDDSVEAAVSSVPVVVGVATGAFLFLADLVRKIKLPITVDFVRVESYGSGIVSSGNPKMSCDVKVDVRDRHVILVSFLLLSIFLLLIFFLGYSRAYSFLLYVIRRRIGKELILVHMLEKFFSSFLSSKLFFILTRSMLGGCLCIFSEFLLVTSGNTK